MGAAGTLNLNANTSATLVIKAKVNSGSARTYIVNPVSITATTQPDAITSNNTDTVTVYVYDADLAVTKTVDKPSPISENDTLTYTITLKNNGVIPVKDIKVTDVLPTYLTYLTSTPGKSIYNQFTGIWGTDNNLDLAAGELQTLTIQAIVNAGSSTKTFINTATITSASSSDSISANNTASVSSTVGAADLALTKTVDKASPNVGDTVTYVITVTNNGPQSSLDVKIKDLLPSGVTYVSSTVTEATYVSATGIWGSLNNLDLLNGETQKLTIKAKVNAGTAGTALINTATITYASQGDGVPANNTATVTSAVGNADMSLTNVANATVLYPGNPVTYTVTLKNNGPTTAAGFSVTEPLPSGLTYVSSSATLGTYNATTGAWSFGSSQLAVSGTAVLTVNATVAANTEGKTINNKAYITAAQGGNILTNDTATAVLKIHGADLEISKTVNKTTPKEGDTLVYVVTLKNNGPDTAKAIKVMDDLPLSLQFISAVTTQGSYSWSASLWDGISLAPGASTTMTINAFVRESQQVENRATVIASSQPDGTTSNNTAAAVFYGTKNFTAGAAIIDMGVTPQTYNNGLKPFGLIYELVITKKIPVYWVINPNKSFVNPASKQDQVDITVAGKNYRTGAFVIQSEFIPLVKSLMDSWIAANPGLTIDYNRPAFTAPIHALVTSFPRAVLDAQNGDKIRDAFYLRAGVSDSSYRNDGSPSNLGACDDIYAMPHADPQNWVKMEKDTLYKFINNGGWMWAACHAVSAIETLVDVNGDGVGDMNYLSNTGLVLWNDHNNASPPFVYNTAAGLYAPNLASDPFMQFAGTFDGSLQNGSEQIYIPFAAGWRSSTVLAVTNPTQTDVANGTYLPGPAAAAAYGRAYGDPLKGMLMYEASHSVAGGSVAENVSAARMYGNFLLEAGVEFKPKIATKNLPVALTSGVPALMEVSTKGKALPLAYTWTSDCGGTFSAQNGPTTTFTPPGVNAPSNCIIRVSVTDACGRKNFLAQVIMVYPQADLSIRKTGPASVAAGSPIQYTLTVKNNGPSNVTDAYVRDTLPAGLINVTYKVNNGPSLPFPASDSIFVGAITALDSAKIVVSATVQPGICAAIRNTAYVSSSVADSVPSNNSSTATTSLQDSIRPVVSCPVISGSFCFITDVAIYKTFTEFRAAGGTASDNCGLDSASFIWNGDVTVGNIVTRTYIIKDLSGNIGSCSQNITINPKPVVTLTAGPTCISNQSSYSIVFTVTSGTAPFTASATVGSVSVAGNQVTVAGIPTGSGSVVTVTDAKTCQSTYTKTPYTCGNCPVTAAIISSDADNIICQGDAVQISTSVSGGVLPYIYTWSPSIGTGAGPYTLHPTTTTTYQLIVKDDNGNGCSDTTQLTINVNSKPDISAAVTATPVCRTQSSVISYSPNSGLTTVGWFTANASCIPSGGSLGNSLSLTVSPAATTIYAAIVQDGNGCRDTGCATLTILNCLPTAVVDYASTNEDISVTIPVLANDTFGGNGASTGVITITDNANYGAATVNNGGTPNDPTDDRIIYTPNANYNGKDTFIYRICDSDGDCDTAIVFININSVNDLPLANADNASVNEDTSVTISVLTNDTFGGDSPSTGAITITDNTNHGVATVNNGGTPNDPTDDKIQYTPTANYNGNDTLIYRICDLNGDCDTAIVYITVNSVNDLPVANADNANVNEDSSVTVQVLTNDTFGGDGAATGAISIIDNSNYGTSTVNNNGTPNDPTDDKIIYTPNANYHGNDTLIYNVCDANGDCDTAIVYITVNSINDLPLANAENENVDEDENLVINVLSNDTFGGDGPSASTITIVSTSPHGASTVDDGGTPNDPTDDLIIYTPDANYNGSDTFIYQICDADGDCDTAIVYITVNSVNDLPIANADNSSVDEDSSVTISILTNDTFGGDGPSATTITIVNIPDHGTANIDDGSTPNDPTDDEIIYTPNANYNGKDTLIYQVCDANGDCDTAIVYINVNSINDLPVANADNVMMLEDATVDIDVLINDDFGGDGPIVGPIGITVDPTHGTATVNERGTPNDPTDDQIVYTPNADYNGLDTLIYEICDDNEDCDTAIVYIRVNSDDDLPFANADHASVIEDSTVTVAILTNDIFGGDGPSNTTITITNNTNHGTSVVDDGGTPNDPTDDQIIYTPDPIYFGEIHSMYQICDFNGDCDTAIVYLTVTPVNDPPVAVDDADTNM